MSLLAELKRRNVFRASAAYIALGWIVLQVTETLVPALHLPEWTVALVFWIGLIGFPFVVLFSWVYELTPDGLKRESEVARGTSITGRTGQRLDHIIIGLLVVAIGLAVWQRLAPPAPPSTSADGAIAAGSGAATVPEASGEAKRASMAEVNEPDKSIAVLPFVDMSQAKDQEYFSDGIAEELLNLLAKIPELRVAARTSSFSFKNKELEIPEIAQRLHVANVLEGSVRKAGSTVRITAQLVRAADGYHLWSDTWDRPLDDIFAVQDEIAGAVVAQLKLKLLGEVPKARVVNEDAYALLLQAREAGRAFSEQGFERSNALYKRALDVDPQYAAAWSGIARNYNDQAAYGLSPIHETYRLAREAADRALAIDPDLALTHAVLGDIAMYYDGDSVSAARHYTRALEIEPGNADILSSAGLFAMTLDRPDLAIALVNAAVERDPVNPTIRFRQTYVYVYTDRLDEAIAAAKELEALNPDAIAARTFHGFALLFKGDPAAALVEIEQEKDLGFHRIGMAIACYQLGRRQEADAALQQLVDGHASLASYNIGYVHAVRGEPDEAFAWLDKAVPLHDAGLAEIAVQPLFDNIRDDPRWLPFLRKIGKAPEQLAAVRFDVKAPD